MTDPMTKQQILDQRNLLEDEREKFMDAADRSAAREIDRKQAVSHAALQEACSANGGHVMHPDSYIGLCFVCGCETKTGKQTADANLLRG